MEIMETYHGPKLEFGIQLDNSILFICNYIYEPGSVQVDSNSVLLCAELTIFFFHIWIDFDSCGSNLESSVFSEEKRNYYFK